MVVGSDRNNILRLVGGRVARILVVVPCMVPCGGNESYSLGCCFIDGFLHRGRVSASTPRVGSQVYPDFGGIRDGFHPIGEVTPSGSSQKLDAHHGSFPTDPNHALAVVANTSDCSGAMGAVTIVIVGVVVVVVKVPAVNIVDIPISIIILPITWNFIGVGPHVGFKVFMITINTGIDNAH